MKKEHPAIKSGLHPRNKHRERYDFRKLIVSCPELAPFVNLNKYNDESIDFFNPEAVKLLNKALLKKDYGIVYWDLPPNYLCPPIPGRADYIHHISDLLADSNPKGKNLNGAKIHCLDIGVGANCIYPIIGNKEYEWTFVASDIDKISLESAEKIIEMNPQLTGKIELRFQPNPRDIFRGIIQKNEFYDLTICNPPFHASAEEANAGTKRKIKNLNPKKNTAQILNFGGQNNELWCVGGEEKFVRDLIYQSRQFSNSSFWFSTLISKQSNLKQVYRTLKDVAALEVKTIPMSQGNKISRIVAWTFLSKPEQQKWIDQRWS